MPLPSPYSLLYVNISYNRFIGPILNSWLKFLNSSSSSFLDNPNICILCKAKDLSLTGINYFSRCHQEEVIKKKKKKLSQVAIVTIALGLSLLCVLVPLVLFLAILVCLLDEMAFSP